jgi:hypothetical protein
MSSSVVRDTETHTPEKDRPAGKESLLKKLLLSAALCFLFFVILEGFASIVFVAWHLMPSHAQSRGLSGPHLQFDKELGWISVPNFFRESYYAPGTYLRTNSQGFRADAEFTQHIPPGKIRVLCSGDSQTFGDGVGNERTWCQDLENMDPRFQTVNIAEVGYGLDQMYLRYKRSAPSLDHDVHLFAFVTDNFKRMRYTAMGGFGKPVLSLENGELKTSIAAVGSHSSILRFLALKPNPLRQFRSVAVVADIADSIKAKRPVPVDGPSAGEREVVDKMFTDLQAMNKNGVFVLVYLPTRTADYKPGGPSEPWRAFMREESARRGVPFIDVVESFEKLPITTKDGMFIWPGATQFFAESPGHYDDQGQEYMARQVYARLLAMPAVADRLARPTPQAR